jgi:hypothetical protein
VNVTTFVVISGLNVKNACNICHVSVARTLWWENVHEKTNKQDKDDCVEYETTELCCALWCSDP